MNTTGYMAVLDKYILWLLNTLASLFGPRSYMYIYGCWWIGKLLLIIGICRKIKQIVSVDFGYIPMKLPFAIFWRFVWRMMRQRWLFITVDYHHVGCSGTLPRLPPQTPHYDRLSDFSLLGSYIWHFVRHHVLSAGDVQRGCWKCCYFYYEVYGAHSASAFRMFSVDLL